jgi:nucleotide-binding universal stress UspA family protein
VEGARRQAEAAGLDCDVVLRDGADGTACELIASEALAWPADVIVMGATTVAGAGLRPGSVGARILQASPVPVLAISSRSGRR